jgi:DNA-binding CsgD family transcriptional regulator
VTDRLRREPKRFSELIIPSNVNLGNSLKVISKASKRARVEAVGRNFGSQCPRRKPGTFFLGIAPVTRNADLRKPIERLTGLSLREQQITNLTCNGLSNKAIADRLGLSEGTVKIHLHHIYRKLGVGSRHELVALAVRGERSS